MEENNFIYENGKIFTSDEDNLHADSMIVENGYIKWIGKKEDRPTCDFPIIDLNNACVLPGFVDAHMHPVMLADFSKEISALPPKVNSIKDLIAEIKTKAQQLKKDNKNEWILGWGYDEGKFAEKRSITRWDLDEGTEDFPVAIIRTCGHIRCVNSKALALAGIDKNTKDPEGGQIERDEFGEPTGVLKENARNLVLPYIPELNEAEKVQNLVDLGDLLTSQGIVAVCDMGNLDKSDNYTYYKEAIAKGFKQEVSMYYMWDFFMHDKDFAISKEKQNNDNQVFVAGLKLIGDGSVSGKTAWMDKPYLNSDSCGISVCSDEQLETAIDFCKQNKCQLSVHAMGTNAIKRVVDRVYAEKDWLNQDRPYVRVEHITLPSQDSINKAVEKNIGFVTQPIFLYAEIESYLQNLGEDIMKECYPIKSLLEQKVNLCFSTDAPATSWAVPSDPFVCIKGAVTRKAYDNTDCGDDQIIDMKTAIILYTKKSAQIAGFKNLGQLKTGYKANFITLDRDIFAINPQDVDKVKVNKTYINGKCVFAR